MGELLPEQCFSCEVPVSLKRLVPDLMEKASGQEAAGGVMLQPNCIGTMRQPGL